MLMNAVSWSRLGQWCFQRRIPLISTLIRFDIGARTIAGTNRACASEIDA